MHYNIPPPADFSAFNISAVTMAKCNISRPQLILFVHVRYSTCLCVFANMFWASLPRAHIVTLVFWLTLVPVCWTLHTERTWGLQDWVFFLYCHRYQGRREETNMVIINIKLLSGYILDKSSLTLVSWSATGCEQSCHILFVLKTKCIWFTVLAAEWPLSEARGYGRRIHQHLLRRGR